MTDSKIKLELPDGDIDFVPDFFAPLESQTLAADLFEMTPWKHESIKIFGKPVLQPRLTAWYGDSEVNYTYSGLVNVPKSWTQTLLLIKSRVEEATGTEFNGALLNLYRNESDSMGWHSDDEKVLGENPIIASVSFGAVRTFALKHKTDPCLKRALALTDGSLLIMQGPTQHHWKHQIPKSAKPIGPRINITFRHLLQTPQRPLSCTTR